jgi:hypothetical protein
MAKRTTRAPSLPKSMQVPELGLTGVPGFSAFGGFVVDDVLRELIGKQARSIYREMADNDPTCGALIFAFNTLLRSADWTFQSVGESNAANEAQLFAEDVFFNDIEEPFTDSINEAATMLIYGWALQEIVWKRREKDNRIGIKRFAPRRQPSIWQWQFDDKGPSPSWDVLAAIQQPPSGTMITIPLNRCVHFKTQPAAGNPEGRSILRSAYRSWSLKKRIENIEGTGLERDLAGLPVLRVPGSMMTRDADPEQKSALNSYKTLIKRIKRDSQEGVILPSDRDASGHYRVDLTLLASAGSRQIDTTKIVDRYNKSIAMCVLADFIFLGQQSVGSFALSSDKTELFGVAISGFLDIMRDAYQRQVVKPLWDYNGFDPELMPKLQHSDVEQTGLAEIATLLSAMVGAGAMMFPDRDLENVLRRRMGLPEAPEDGLEDQGAPGAKPKPKPGTNDNATQE